MSNQKITAETAGSKSKAKRLEKQAEVARAKKKAFIAKIIGFAILAVACLAIIAVVADSLYYRFNQTKPSSDYSATLLETGLIENVNTADYEISGIDFDNLIIPNDELVYAEESIESDITKLQTANRIINDDATLTVADGDTVSIEYVGTTDGEEFAGGSTTEAVELTIGSETYYGNFEEQLIGAHPGDTVTVEIDYPEDFRTSIIAGKHAVFTVDVHGIYETPEFDDAFVQTHLSEYASTAEEYRSYLAAVNYASNLEKYIKNYIATNASASSYPKEYVEHLKGILRYEEEDFYESYTEFYKSSMGEVPYESFFAYKEMNEKEYEQYLTASSRQTAAANIYYQSVFEEQCLTITDDEYATYVSTMEEGDEATYGKAYVMQRILQDKVIDYLAEKVTIQ